MVFIQHLRGEAVTLYSADNVVDDVDAETYATEYLNTVNIPNLPLHTLKLKIGAPVILLRNLSPSTGLCNGTRLRVSCINQRVIECEILGGKHAGNMVLIPRIPLSPSSTAESPFDFRRTQFPIRLAFVMTINKSQGHSTMLDCVLLNPCLLMANCTLLFHVSQMAQI